MVFSSITFLCVFLPVILIFYNLIKDKTAKNILLIIASLLFYAYGEPVYVLLMIFCSFFNYFMARLIDDDKAHPEGAKSNLQKVEAADNVKLAADNSESAAGAKSTTDAESTADSTIKIEIIDNNTEDSETNDDAKELNTDDQVKDSNADSKAKSINKAKLYLIFTIVVDILILGVFKYLGLVCQTLNFIPGVKIIDPQIALPIGISFFTFQAMSYVVDVYEGKVASNKSFMNILLYISFFPQLIAGPIVKYYDIEKEINNRSVSTIDLAEGFRRFIFGLSKKVLIANTLGQTADYVYSLGNSKLSGYIVWIGAISYMLQIYFDFSGYSDMAIGLGRLFGFHFKENFDHPYVSSSVQEFWRRWHISLTNWFREYVYIPLGGNRKGQRRTWINRMFIFFLTGLWHGASFTFIIWGLFHGLFLTLETIFPNYVKKLGKLSHLYVLLVVCIGFVFFRSDNVAQALTMIGLMFTGFAMNQEKYVALMSVFSLLFIITLIVSVIASTELVKIKGKLSYIASFALLILCMISLAGSTYNPFIYFRF